MIQLHSLGLNVNDVVIRGTPLCWTGGPWAIAGTTRFDWLVPNAADYRTDFVGVRWHWLHFVRRQLVGFDETIKNSTSWIARVEPAKKYLIEFPYQLPHRIRRTRLPRWLEFKMSRCFRPPSLNRQAPWNTRDQRIFQLRYSQTFWVLATTQLWCHPTR